MWRFCRPPITLQNAKFQDSQYRKTDGRSFLYSARKQYLVGNEFGNEPVVLQSFLNIFNVRQITVGENGNSILFFNVPIKAEVDPDVSQKVNLFLDNFIKNLSLMI